MIVIDNVITEEMQDALLNICTIPEFPWSFLMDSTFVKNDELAQKMNKPQYPSFCHLAFIDRKPKTDFYNITSDIISNITESSELNFEDLFRVRFGLYLPIKNPPLYNNIHVDMKIPHKVCLYYVNDTDGDTFFFDRNRQVCNRISPKKGRAVVFDGLTLHASSMPSKKYRISLNLGYVANN